MAGPGAGTSAETDLYGPVRDYLIAQGYIAQGEVRRCDVAAVRADELVVVELKLQFTTEAIVQAARRQELTDTVYIAVERPRDIRAWRTRHRDRLFLVRRLELGLLLVAPGRPKASRVTVEVPIALFDRVKSGKQRKTVIREVRKRCGDFNTGGSVRQRLLGAHRATAVHIACCLREWGPLAIAELRKLGTSADTASVLEASPRIEGWFSRDEDGRWSLTQEGEQGLLDHAEAAAHFRTQLGLDK